MNSKKKVVIIRDLEEQYIREISEVIPEWDIITGADRSNWEPHLHDAEIIADWNRIAAIHCFNKNAKLRWVQAWSAGVNNLPLEEFEKRDIYLTSANGVHAYPISETIFALMLALTRNIHKYVRDQQTRTWDSSMIELEIHQKTIGIIGIGAIGKETAKIAKAFGMNVLGVRHSGKPVEFVDHMYTTEDLSIVLSKCDYVVNTLPSTNETYHLIGKQSFAQMKPSAFFINIGRGDTVVEEDLIAALKSGQIAGAGLDVFEEEPLSETSPLWDMENVIITPHTSGSTKYYDQRAIRDIFLPNLKSYLETGMPSLNVVDYSKGY